MISLKFLLALLLFQQCRSAEVASTAKQMFDYTQFTYWWEESVKSINDTQYFWKSEWHNEWFPLPQKLQDRLNASPFEPVHYGIYLHENPRSVYGYHFCRYILDPSQLAVWQFGHSTTVDTEEQGTVVVFLKSIDSSGKELEADRSAIDESKCPYSLHDFQRQVVFRPSELPPNPKMLPIPTGAGYHELHELEFEFFSFHETKWISYPLRIQRQLNRSDEPIEFAIYFRQEWPELFGGSYNRYLIDPKKLFQISLSWARARPIAKVHRATGKFEVSTINPVDFRFSYDFTKHYPDAKKIGIYGQKDLKRCRVVQASSFASKTQ